MHIQNASEDEENSDESVEPREQIFESEYKIKLINTNRQTTVTIQVFPLPSEGYYFFKFSRSVEET